MIYREVKLLHEYNQFSGVFFFWLYLSFDRDVAPRYWKFILPSGRTVFAETDSEYFNSARLDLYGLDSLKGTRAGQLLSMAYRAPDFLIDPKDKSNWGETFIRHAAQYYACEENYLGQVFSSPLNGRTLRLSNNFKDNGICRLLMLVRHTEEELAQIDALSHTDGELPPDGESKA